MNRMRKIKKREASRLRAFVLAAALLCGNWIAAPLPVQATSCSHVHDENCGYAEAVSCGHTLGQHDDVCGYVEAKDCGHVCSADLGCVVDDVSGNNNCAHTAHDDSCGYVEGGGSMRTYGP